MDETFIQRGGLWVVIQSVLLLAVAALAVIFPGDWRHLAASVAGAVLLVLGGVIGVAGVVVLGKSRTPFPKPPEHTQLVQRGVYSLMRHPLYTSVILAALGWALLWQSWPSLVLALTLGPFFDAKARREERWLLKRFPGYTAYCQRVRRFIPGIY